MSRDHLDTAPYVNPSARVWYTEPLAESPTEFHRSLPGYTQRTPRGLGPDSVVVLLSTEGATANPKGAR